MRPCRPRLFCDPSQIPRRFFPTPSRFFCIISAGWVVLCVSRQSTRPPPRSLFRLFSAARLREKHRPGFAAKGGAGQVQGLRPCRGSKGEQPFAGRDKSEDLRGQKSSRRGGGKQPPDVERRESHRTKKISAISVADGERSNSRHIVRHAIHRPSEDGEAVRSRCRASPAARGSGVRGAPRTSVRATCNSVRRKNAHRMDSGGSCKSVPADHAFFAIRRKSRAAFRRCRRVSFPVFI